MTLGSRVKDVWGLLFAALLLPALLLDAVLLEAVLLFDAVLLLDAALFFAGGTTPFDPLLLPCFP